MKKKEKIVLYNKWFMLWSFACGIAVGYILGLVVMNT